MKASGTPFRAQSTGELGELLWNNNGLNSRVQIKGHAVKKQEGGLEKDSGSIRALCSHFTFLLGHKREKVKSEKIQSSGTNGKSTIWSIALKGH